MKQFIGKTLLILLLASCAKEEPLTKQPPVQDPIELDTLYNVKYEYLGDCCTHRYYYTYNDSAYAVVYANGSENWEYSFIAKNGTKLELWGSSMFGGNNYNRTRITIFVNGIAVKTDYDYIPDTLKYTL